MCLLQKWLIYNYVIKEVVNLLYSCNIATIEYEAELRHKNEMTRLEAELRGKYVCL